MGKSTILENMAVQDITNGNGLAFIDPHGKTAQLLLEYVPEHRVKDVLYFAPFDIEHPVSFNVMEDVGPERRHLVVNGLMSAFKKLFGEESFSDRMQYILQNAILALLEYPGATMLGINKMFADKAYRDAVVANVTDSSVKAYWEQEFAGYTDRFAAEATPAIQNKIGQFTSNPLIRNIIGQPKSSFDIRKLMDEGKIIIINLSKGLVGESNANLLGSMLITKMYLAAMSRADASQAQLSKLPNFYLYVDEFQSFANESFADILSEARKYKLNLTIAHQYIEQMSDEVRAAVFGNVGTMMSFRVGSYDAEVLEKEFAPYFLAQDIVNLDKYQLYLKLMIDGVASQPFSAVGLAPIEKPIVSFTNKILETSRANFAQPRAAVEAAVREFQAEYRPPQKNKEEQPKDKPQTQLPKSIQSVAPKAPMPQHQEVKPREKVIPIAAVEKKVLPKEEGNNALKKALEAQLPNLVPKKERPSVSDIEKAIASGDIVPVEAEPKKQNTTEKVEVKDHTQDLRSALAGLLKEQQKKAAPIAPVAPVAVVEKKEPEKVAEQKNDTPQEVPEEILRKVFDINQ
jgi:hypothetical protein